MHVMSWSITGMEKDFQSIVEVLLTSDQYHPWSPSGPMPQLLCLPRRCPFQSLESFGRKQDIGASELCSLSVEDTRED